MNKSFKIVSIAIATVLGLLLLSYFFAPVYQFAKPSPFSGEKLLNPYQNINPSDWIALSVEGRASVRQPSKLIHDSYSVFAESQKIVKHENTVPSYTHGFNFFKTRQLCIGSKEVLWIDLPLYQTSGHKQWIIDRLVPFNEIVVLENPGYSFDNLKKLSNYNLLEISNGKTISLAEWDTALSAGHRAYLLSDSRLKSGVSAGFTMVYAPNQGQDEIVHALKNGISYGVTVPPKEPVLRDNGGAKLESLSTLRKVDLKNDSLTIVLSKEAAAIRFIRQDGKVVKTGYATDSAFYVIQPHDQYIRTEVDFKDGTVYYLNPVTRYSDENTEPKPITKVDVSATGWLRLLYFTAVALMFWYFTRKLPGKSEKK